MNTPLSEMGVDGMILVLEIMEKAGDAILSAYSIQVFEWISTLGEEVELIHKTPWSLIKVAYLLCRYCPLFTQPIIIWGYLRKFSKEFCLPVVRPLYFLLLPLHVFPQGVMLLRAYAFSGRRTWCLISLLICFIAVCGSSTWALYDGKNLPDFYYQFLGKAGCFPYYGGGEMSLKLGTMMIVATFVDLYSLILMIYFCTETYGSTGLAGGFISQGLIGFTLTALVNVIATAMFYTKSTFADYGAPLSTIIGNTVACRIILHLKASVSIHRCPYQQTSFGARIQATVDRSTPLGQWTIAMSPPTQTSSEVDDGNNDGNQGSPLTET